jgi:RNA polymerase sigma-32 factor
MNARDCYARDVGRLPVLSAPEQRELADRYARTRDPRLAQRLVLANLRLVMKIAAELARPGDNLMDLVQEGNAGLMHAVERYDPSRGVRLSTYAAWWIRAYVRRQSMESSRVVRFASTRDGRRRYFAGTLPGADLPLDAAPPGGDDGGRPRRAPAETLAAADQHRPDVQIEQREYLRAVGDAVTAFEATLDRRSRCILRDRLLADDPPPLRAVAGRFAITGERARQIEKRLLADLRDAVGPALAA